MSFGYERRIALRSSIDGIRVIVNGCSKERNGYLNFVEVRAGSTGLQREQGERVI